VETYNNGSPTPEFNNAGQVFNHDFYWESISPSPSEYAHQVFDSCIVQECNSLPRICWHSADDLVTLPASQVLFFMQCCDLHSVSGVPRKLAVAQY
jgi:hypothetical protein